MNLSLDKIIIDAGTQSRTEIKELTIAEYATKMQEGIQFPPIIVFHDGANYFLADGFHRYFAAKKCGAPGIKCDVREGTVRDAKLYSFGANDAHGLQRTIADKRKSVISMLTDEEWGNWSDREIAAQCKVSHTFVANIRKEIGAEKEETKYMREGKVVTRKEPKKAEQPAIPQEPEAEFTEEDVEKETMEAAVQELQRQNEELQDKLTVAMAASQDDLDREMAESVIKDLRAQIRMAEIELKEVKISRDTFMRENAELKKQILSLQKKLKKLEPA